MRQVLIGSFLAILCLFTTSPSFTASGWYDKNQLELKALTVEQSYYFAAEAFNEKWSLGENEDR